MLQVSKLVLHLHVIIITKMSINRKLDKVYRHDGITKEEFTAMM